MAKLNRTQLRDRRHARVRRKVSGTAERPRLNVYRSNQHIYAQVIDDVAGRTLASASTLDKELRAEMADMSAEDRAQAVGRVVAERASSQGIRTVVFDRGGYPYHGRVKILAEASREAGLEF